MTASSSLSFQQKLAYGSGAIAYAVPNQAMASFFLFYVTALLHIDPVIAGIIVSISVLWDAVTDPWLGSISDRTHSVRFGRRHLYLLIGGLGTALGMVLLWSISDQASDIYKITVLMVLVLFCKTMLTFYGAPYFALGGSLSSHYDERSSLQGYRAAFHVLGMIIAIAGMSILFFRSTADYPKGQLNPEAYPVMGHTIAVITMVSALLAVKLIPKDNLQPARPSFDTTSVWKQVLAALGNANFRAMILMILMIEIGFQVSISIGFHIGTYTYNLTGPEMGLISLIILLFSILSQPFWLYFTRRFEKKTALIAALFFGLAGFVGQPVMFVILEWLPLNHVMTVPLMMGFSVLSGIGNGAFMSIPFSMVADTVDQGELKTGQRQEGLYFGLYNFAYKTGIAVSVLIGGILLDAIGFDSSQEIQSATTAYNLAVVPAWMLLVLSPVIYWSASKYQLDRKQHDQILAQLGTR